MQERYLGDVHDFGKFVLLRAITEKNEPHLKLGINWYLTCPHEVDSESSNDGNLRYHQADSEEFQNIDHYTLERLRSFSDPNNRKIERLESIGLFPEDTKFFPEKLSPKLTRDTWFSHSLECLSKCDLVFLDPDTGLETASSKKNSRRLPKYVLAKEINKHFEAKQSVVFIQFVQRQTIESAINKVRKKLNLSEDNVRILHYRVAPTVLFFFIIHKSHRKTIEQRLDAFLSEIKKKSDRFSEPICWT